MKPPGPLNRLEKPTAGAGPMPATSARPTTMKATIATTLINANQYSNSPNRLTCAVLIGISPAARTGEADGDGAAQEQTDADRAADRDHRDLPRAQTPLQAFFGC